MKILFTLLIGLMTHFALYAQTTLAANRVVFKDTVLQFAFDSVRHNLGWINPRKNARVTKHFQYIGTETVSITRAWTGDPHYICDYPRGPLKPNKTYAFSVCFSHKKRTGILSKEMGFDLSNGEKMTFRFTGQYAPQIWQNVQITGAMKNVMWKGMLKGTVFLDTLPREHLYGMGPMENLTGELLVLDGTSYISTVAPNGKIKVSTSFEVKAPFFAYDQVREWDSQSLPDSVTNLNQLEKYLADVSDRPFMFLLTGTLESAMIHVVNLPRNAAVHSPDEAHEGMQRYTLNNEVFDVLGFYSTEHKAIFTHHDTFLHLHLITADRSKMGHLEEIRFKKGAVQLLLPKPR
jgi:acetolactate decarboxylase